MLQVLVLAPGPWKIVAELENRNGVNCSVIDDMKSLGSNYQRSRAGLIAAIEMVAKEGHTNKPWIETASSTNPRVYKFVKGDLRLYFCFADGRVLVCSCCAIKKTQRTEKPFVAAALDLLERYKSAVAGNELQEIEGYDRIRKLR